MWLRICLLWQVKLLQQSFKTALGEEGARMVDINTIDGFQVGWGGARVACAPAGQEFKRVGGLV